MQSTGQTATQPVSRQSRQSRVMMYAIDDLPGRGGRNPRSSYRRGVPIATRSRRFDTRAAAGLIESTTVSFTDAEVPMPIRFPSLEFFEALRNEMRVARERFSRLGFFDTTFVLRVLDAGGETPFEATLAFEVFDCVGVRAGAGENPDFVLEGGLAAWREMLDTIHALGATDAAHSINTLTHFGEALQVRYDDPDGHDKLYRFAESIQEYFDLSAGLDFVYPDGSAPPPRADAVRRSGT